MSPFFTGSKSPGIILSQLPTVWEGKTSWAEYSPSLIYSSRWQKKERSFCWCISWLLVAFKDVGACAGAAKHASDPEGVRGCISEKRGKCQGRNRNRIKDDESGIKETNANMKAGREYERWKIQSSDRENDAHRSSEQVWLAAGKSIWGYHGPLEACQVIQAVIDSVLTLRHRSSSQKHLLYNGCLRCITRVIKDSPNMQPMWQSVTPRKHRLPSHYSSSDASCGGNW